MTRVRTADELTAAADQIDALTAALAVSEAEVARLKQPKWYCLSGSDEQGYDTPEEAIDYHAEAGQVYEIDTSRCTGKIWVATVPTGDDREWDLQEFATKAEARAALLMRHRSQGMTHEH